MSSVSGISSPATYAADTQADDTSSRVPQKQLGQADFMKLLAVQFQSQDPMKPMEDTTFIANMAQFSSLQQSSSMAADLKEMRADQQKVTANSYLGHRVTFDTGDAEPFTGDVSGVDVSGSEPKLIVGDKTFSLSSVLLVQPNIPAAAQAANGSN